MTRIPIPRGERGNVGPVCVSCSDLCGPPGYVCYAVEWFRGKYVKIRFKAGEATERMWLYVGRVNFRGNELAGILCNQPVVPEIIAAGVHEGCAVAFSRAQVLDVDGGRAL